MAIKFPMKTAMPVRKLVFLAWVSGLSGVIGCSTSSSDSSFRPNGGQVDLAGTDAVTLAIPPFFEGDQEVLRVKFKVVNDTGKQVQKPKLTTSCSCSKAWLEKPKLEVGDETELWVEASLRGRYGPQRFTCSLELVPDQVRVFQATTTIFRKINLIPDTVRFENVDPGTEYTSEVVLESAYRTGQEPPRLAQVSSPIKDVSVTSVEENQVAAEEGIAKKRWKLQVKARPGEQEEGMAQVKVTCACSDGPKDVVLPVRWRLRTMYDIRPPRAFFGKVTSDSAHLEKKIVVRRTDGIPLVIQRIKSSDVAVTATCRKDGVKEQMISLKLDPGRFTGSLYGEVELETNCRQQPLLKLRFVAVKEK